MSREIKFRVWDFSEKEMVDHIQLINDPDNWLQGLLSDDFDEGDVLMQYTNLKDADEKDIYEGDILSSKEYYNENLEANYKRVGVVKYDNGYGDGDVGYYLEGKEFKNGVKWRNFKSDLKKATYDLKGNYNKKPISNSGWIIGNIFENPELLTK